MFHRHKWETIHSKQMRRLWWWQPDSNEGSPFTILLQVCKGCDRVRTQELAGDWTPEEIKGKGK